MEEKTDKIRENEKDGDEKTSSRCLGPEGVKVHILAFFRK
jgi:hypothetical protein